MNTILFNDLIEKIKKDTAFESQNKLWKAGFESALKVLEDEMKANGITFMPTEINDKMLIERENEHKRWKLKKTHEWEVHRQENAHSIVFISTNAESIASQQIHKIREKYCYRAICQAFSLNYVQKK